MILLKILRFINVEFLGLIKRNLHYDFVKRIRAGKAYAKERETNLNINNYLNIDIKI